MTAIYALCEPGTGRVRYVGATQTDVRRRLGRLLSHARRGERYPVCVWLRGLERPPDVMTLELDPRNLRVAERWWIQFLREQGSDLLNVYRGGNGFA